MVPQPVTRARLWAVLFLLTAGRLAALDQSADLALGRSVSASVVAAGNNASYTLQITNLGPASSTVLLTNILSSRSTFVSATPSQGTCAQAAGIVSCNLGPLGAGEKATVILTARIGAGTNTLSARVTSELPDSNPANNSILASIAGTVTLPTFSNPDTIILPLLEPGPGSVYPSSITVNGQTAAIFKATVTLRTVNHDFPDDIDVLLVSPRGQKIYLMSDCGLDNALVDVTITLDDAASQELPDTDPPIVSGTYRPSNYGTLLDDFAAPAPPPPYATNLSVLNGTDPNGVWSLYVMDDQAENGSTSSTEGFLADGWSLTLITGEPMADLVLTQTDQPDPIVAGNTLTYSLTVTNRGPSPALAEVRDLLPPGVSFVSGSASQGACAENGGVVTCSLGQLALGAGATVSLKVIPFLGGSITNTVTVFGPQQDPNPTNSSSTVVTTVTPIADLELAVAASANPALQGEPVSFLLTVTNRGPSAAPTVELTNVLPTNLSFAQALTTQGTCANQAGTVVCLLNTLAGGQGALVQITGTAGPPGVSSNFTTVSTSQLETTRTNNSVGLAFTVLPAADVSLQMSPSGPLVALNSPLTLLVTATNRGPSSAVLTLTNLLPPSVQFVSASPSRGSCVGTASGVGCDFGNVPAGASALVVLTLRPQTAGPSTNLLLLSSSLSDPTPNDHVLTNIWTAVQAADLVLTLNDALDPIWLGENLIYRISVTNRGPNSATAVNLTNQLPPGLEVLSVFASQGFCAQQGDELDCEVGTLSVGAGALFTVALRPASVALLTATVRATSELFDPIATNSQAVQTTQVVDVSGRGTNAGTLNIPRLGLADPYPSTLLLSGFTAAVYSVRVTLTNLTHSFADDLDVLLVAPNGRGVLLMSDVGGDSAFNQVTLEFDDQGSDLPNSSQILSGRVRPGDFEPGDIFPAPAPPGPYGTNLASFRGIDPNGLWSLYLLDDADKDSGTLGGWSLTVATLEPINDLVLTERISANPAGVSSNLLFNYTVTNLGPAIAASTRLTNTTPVNLQILSANTSSGNCQVQSGLVTCALGDLPASAGAIVQITARVLTSGTNVSRTTVVSTPLDLVPTNNQLQTVMVFEHPPVLTLQPVSVVATNGDAVRLTAAATGTEPLSYQWQRNGQDLAGATTPELVFLHAAPINSGTYRLRVSNRVGIVRTAPVTVTIIGPPTISDIDPVTIDEDTFTSPIPFTVFDFESPPESLQLFAGSSDVSLVPLEGIVLRGTSTNRSVQVFPLPNAYGVVTISLIAMDPDNGLSTNSFLLTIRPLNDPPLLSAIPDQTTLEDMAIEAPFTAFDLETAPDDLIYTVTSPNAALYPPGSMTFSGTGTNRLLHLLASPNSSGSARITVSITDAGGATASSAFNVFIAPVNDPPTLAPIADLTLPEDSGPQVVQVTGIGSGAADEVEHLVVEARSSLPTLIPHPLITYVSPAAEAQLTFAPRPNASGPVPITVTVRDGNTTNASFSRTFVVNLIPTNDPPLLSGLSDQTMSEDDSLGLPFTVSDPESPAGALVLTVVSSNPQLFSSTNLTLSGEGQLRVLTLHPATNEFGQATVVLTATDPDGASSSNVFVVTVVSVNDAPSLDPLLNRTLAEDAPLQVISLSGITSGAANETESLTLHAVSSDPKVIPDPTISYTNGLTTGTLSYRPAANASGSVTLTVTVDDGQPQNNLFTRSFTVSVNATNDAPVISGLGASAIDEDTLGALPFSVFDPETPALALLLQATSANQALVANTNLSFEGSGTNRILLVRPQPNQNGTVALTVTAGDGTRSSTNTFNLTINPLNDPPTLNPLTNLNITVSPGAVSVPLSGISSGATNETQALTITASSSNPALFVNAPNVSYPGSGPTGTLTFRPANNTLGTATITVTVDDGGAVNRTFSRSFVLNVRAPANALPTLSLIPNQSTLEDTPVGPLNFSVRDEETTASALVVTAISSNPSLLPTNNILITGTATNRALTLRPATNQTGVATVTLTATDDAFGSTNMAFTLTVNAVNDAPTISPIANLATFAGVPAGPVNVLIDDIDHPAAVLELLVNSSNPTLLPNANILVGGSGGSRALLLTPAGEQVGVATITVRVTDGALTNSTAFTLTVSPSNQPPVLGPLSDLQMTEDTPSTPVAFLVSDHETPANDLRVEVQAAEPSLLAQLQLGGTGTNRTLLVVPAPEQHGSTLVTVHLTDGADATVTGTFRVTILAVDDPPTLAALPDLFLNQDAPPQSIPLENISSGAANENQTLAVAATVDDTNLLSELTVQYTSPNPTGLLQFVPVPGARGVATVSVTVSDGQSVSPLTRTFTVTLNAPPQIDYLPDQLTLEDTSVGPLTLHLSDAETPPELLQVAVSSSNAALIDTPGLHLNGTGAERQLTLLPATNANGVAMIRIVVTDTNGASATNEFVLTVQPVLDQIVILTPPEDFAGLVGTTATFSVSAVSGLGLTYQWQHDGVELAEATGPVLALPGIQGTSAGEYRVRIQNGEDSVLSAVAHLRVLTQADPPQILSITQTGGTVRVRVTSVLGASYVLEAKGTFTAAAWAPVATLPGTGVALTFTELNVSDAVRFYRVRLSAP